MRVTYGPGYLERGETAARRYRALRDELAERHPYEGIAYDSLANKVKEARELMRAYGWHLDDECGHNH